jgi:hypothetical protein
MADVHLYIRHLYGERMAVRQKRPVARTPYSLLLAQPGVRRLAAAFGLVRSCHA